VVPPALLPAKAVKAMQVGRAHAITRLHLDRPLAAIMSGRIGEEEDQAVIIMCVDLTSVVISASLTNNLGCTFW
jgi:hypothetical protein